MPKYQTTAPSTKNKHREDVKALIRKRGKTLSQLSLEAGLHLDTVNKSLIRPLPRANIAIVKFLGLSLHELWPDWYDQAGQRIPFSGNESNSKADSELRHCQKSSAKLAGRNKKRTNKFSSSFFAILCKLHGDEKRRWASPRLSIATFFNRGISFIKDIRGAL